MRNLALVLLALAGCVPAMGVTTPVLHPTPTTASHSVGIGAGAIYGSVDEGSVLVAPYGEGWVRAPVGSGQLDFHLYPSTGSLGYRFDLSSMAGGGVGFALEPSGHAAYFKTSEDQEDGDDETVGAIFLGAGLTAIVLVPVGSSSFLYLGPRVSITHAELTGDAGEGPDDSVNILGVGTAIGFDLGTAPIATSIELSIQRTSSLDDEDGSEPTLIIVPSIGLRL
jgi:hypothetical protein